jgi:hypothetical protein
MKQLLLSFSILALVLSFSSCKKYEDGPAFSLRGKTARLANEWKTESYSENGVDKTNDWNTFYQGGKLTIGKDGRFFFTYKYNGSYDVEQNGTWDFNSDKTILLFNQTVPVADAWTWKILRLKEHELWVKDTDSSGVEKELHLVDF